MRRAARASVVAGTALGAAVIACGKNKAAPDAKPIDAPVDTKVFNDAPAPNYDFSCLGMPLPTTATANITLSGLVREAATNGMSLTLNPLVGVRMDTCKNGAANCNGNNQLGSGTTDGSGNFSIGPIATATMPLDAFIHLTPGSGSNQGAGDRPANVYPPFPFVANQANIPVLEFTPTVLTLVGTLAGAQQDAGKGLILTAVTDCALMPISGAVVHAQQGGSDVGSAFELSAMGSGGAYLVFNVPPGITTLFATFNGMTFRTTPPQNVTSVAGENTLTQITPGP
jgi:hypothetical protein